MKQHLLKWERINNYHQRAKVPGGWIVEASEPVVHSLNDGRMDHGWDWRIAICFVPDPNHKWGTEYE